MPTFHFKLAILLAALAAPFLADTGSAATCQAVPEQMRAARIAAPGGPESLRVERLPVPQPASGEVLVRVHFASINPVDWKLQEAGRLPFPATPGGDFSGEVVALGPAVDGFACGDLVAGIVDQAERQGSYAEYLTVPVSEIVPKPAKRSMAQAAAYPTVAVAAWRFLVEGATVQAGERVLVHGGAGGVGSMVVQIAKARGATVIATASARNHDYLRGIGADQVIDYTTTRFEDVVSEVDVVVDTVGGDTLARSPAVLRDGGRLVTLVGTVPAELCAAGRIQCPQRAPWNVRLGLAGVAPLIAAGQLRVHIERSYPLAEIAAAQQHNRNGHTRGKVVVDMGATKPADETLVSQTATQWPQISGINRIHFRDHRHNQDFAGNGFLLEYEGTTYAITAKHVLLLARTPDMHAVDLAGTGVQWTIHPNGSPGAGVELGELLNADPDEKLDPSVIERDWLIFAVQENRSSLRALRLRERPLPHGSDVYVLGCAYARAADCRQDALRGTVIPTPDGRLLVDLADADMGALGGLSGAPVVDSEGALVALVSNLAPHPTEARDVLAPARLDQLRERLAQIRRAQASAQRM